MKKPFISFMLKKYQQKWQADVAAFFAEVGRITKDDLKKVGDGKYATDKFLKKVKTPIPAN